MADASENYVPKLKSHYDSVVRQQLQEEFAYPNPMGVPKLTKIVVNMGVGEAIADSKKLDQAAGELAAITGQKPIIVRAKRSVANFKLREGMPIGCNPIP